MPFGVIVFILVALILLAVFMLLRTSPHLKVSDHVRQVELPAVNGEKIAQNLSEIIRCETVSVDGDPTANLAQLREMRRLLEDQYPQLHRTLDREIVSDASLLYRWRGSNLELPAVLFAAHMDVVPADPGTLDQWTHPPFSGHMDDEFIWGRGTLDIKGQITALMDAVEYLIGQGFKPERTLYLAFGQDEEVGGQHGAAEIVNYLSARGESLEAVVDEGGGITEGELPAISEMVAMVGNAEKGHLTLNITAHAKPGHSARPGKTSAIGILANAIQKIEANPLPAHLDHLRDVYQSLGGSVDFLTQLRFANTWLFGPWLKQKYSAEPATNAAIRTTTAVTMVSGGVKDNILPASASAKVNYRLLPGDTVADVTEYTRLVIGDKRVTIDANPADCWEASPAAPIHGSAFRCLSRSIKEIFNNVEVVPYLVQGATDARYYATICDQVFRFTPIITTRDMEGLEHGIDERIRKGSLTRMVQFYAHLINNWAGPDGMDICEPVAHVEEMLPEDVEESVSDAE